MHLFYVLIFDPKFKTTGLYNKQYLTPFFKNHLGEKLAYLPSSYPQYFIFR